MIYSYTVCLQLIIEAKNDADSILYSSEKTLNEYKDKIAAEDKEAIETAIKELREAVEAEDLEQKAFLEPFQVVVL